MYIRREEIFNNVMLEIKKGNTEFDDVVKFMSKDELYEYSCFSLMGMYDPYTNTVLVGEYIMYKVNKFKERMIEKYYKQV